MNSRRAFLAAAAGLVTVLPFRAGIAADAPKRMKIGVIGSGRIGGTVGGLWAKAGHEVVFSDRDPEQVKRALEGLGPNARSGSAKEAAAFGDVVLIAVPYAALPAVGREVAAEIKGKVVIDPNNPIPARDGDMAMAAREKGAGVSSVALLPGARLVRAFSSVGHATLQKEAHRAAPRVAIPVAADDAAALKVGMQLVEDAGFEPVVVGSLASSKAFDPGTPAFGRGLTAAELRKTLGL